MHFFVSLVVVTGTGSELQLEHVRAPWKQKYRTPLGYYLIAGFP
jgi:hypothetical protein